MKESKYIIQDKKQGFGGRLRHRIFVFFSGLNIAIVFRNPLDTENLADLIEVIIDWLVVMGAPVAVFLIIFAGAQYMFGYFSPVLEKQSSPEGLRAARKMIMYTLMGYAIILLSKMIFAVVTGLLP